MPGTLDLSPTDDPRPDEAAGFDRAAGDEGAAPWPEPEPGFDLAAEPAPEVDEAAVRQWLSLAGMGLNVSLPGRNYGVEDAWLATERDLDEMAPPATRILNRHPTLRALATRADVDAFTLAAAVLRYGFTNARDVLEARQADEDARPHIGGRDDDEAPPAPRPNWPGLTGNPSR